MLVVVDNSIFRKYLLANSYGETAAKEKIKEYFNILFAMVITASYLAWRLYNDALTSMQRHDFYTTSH